MDDYLEWCAERGEEPDRPYSGRLLVRMEPPLHRRLADAAARESVSLNAYVVEQLEAGVDDALREELASAP